MFKEYLSFFLWSLSYYYFYHDYSQVKLKINSSFQFDTMFMFMITILLIVGIFEGYSIRKNDIIYHYDLEKAPKALQPSKVICFFVGPVYFFNFIANWSATQGSLSTWLNYQQITSGSPVWSLLHFSTLVVTKSIQI